MFLISLIKILGRYTFQHRWTTFCVAVVAERLEKVKTEEELKAARANWAAAKAAMKEATAIREKEVLQHLEVVALASDSWCSHI